MKKREWKNEAKRANREIWRMRVERNALLASLRLCEAERDAYKKQIGLVADHMGQCHGADLPEPQPHIRNPEPEPANPDLEAGPMPEFVSKHDY